MTLAAQRVVAPKHIQAHPLGATFPKALILQLYLDFLEPAHPFS